MHAICGLECVDIHFVLCFDCSEKRPPHDMWCNNCLAKAEDNKQPSELCSTFKGKSRRSEANEEEKQQEGDHEMDHEEQQQPPARKKQRRNKRVLPYLNNQQESKNILHIKVVYKVMDIRLVYSMAFVDKKLIKL